MPFRFLPMKYGFVFTMVTLILCLTAKGIAGLWIFIGVFILLMGIGSSEETLFRGLAIMGGIAVMFLAEQFGLPLSRSWLSPLYAIVYYFVSLTVLSLLYSDS